MRACPNFTENRDGRSEKLSAVFVGCVVAVCLLAGCREGSDNDGKINLEALPQVEPREILSFDSVGSRYFEFIYQKTIPMEDGSVILGDLSQSPFILRIYSAGTGEGVLNMREDGTNPESAGLGTDWGNLDDVRAELIASAGRGPGEIQDITSINRDQHGNLYVYDQMNNRVSRYLKGKIYDDEFTPETMEGHSLAEVYPMAGDGDYLKRYMSMDYLYNTDSKPEVTLSSFNARSNEYSKRLTLPVQLRAILRQEGGMSAYAVPFTPDQLIAVNPVRNSFMLYWSASGEITEMSPAMDTLRTIPVRLSEEKLNSADRDSVENRFQRFDQPELQRIVQDLLPEYKTPVDRFLIDNQARFWLKLTHRSATQRWLVLDPEGLPQKVVHFPENAVITHVSDKHVGAVVDHFIFTLYEPVE
ncbi:MAG: hypothetical protein WD317_11535 [Balneolaceae bacterium]